MTPAASPAAEQKARTALLSVASNSALVVLKLAVGLLIGSVSVVSEAIHSGIDLLAAIVALLAVRHSDKPADARHPFGHGKLESLSGAFEALLIFAAAIWIVVEAVGKLVHPEPMDLPLLGALVMGFSTAVNYGVSRRLFRVARETESMALLADAWHLRTDVYTSLGVLLALLGIYGAGRLDLGLDLAWLDPAAGLGVALLILKAAFELTFQSAQDLLDQSLPGEEEGFIADTLRARYPTIRGFHKLRTRRSGSFRFIEVHLQVDPDMTVLDAHAITRDLQRVFSERLPSAVTTIHVEPCSPPCSDACRAGCLKPG